MGMEAAAALARLYAAARLQTNPFQPSFKLREKIRGGAGVTKRWHPPVTPAERALASGRLDAESVARIVDPQDRADPAVALVAIRAAQVELGRRVDRRGIASSAERRPWLSTSQPPSLLPGETASEGRSTAGPIAP